LTKLPAIGILRPILNYGGDIMNSLLINTGIAALLLWLMIASAAA
jgi:hypothetical protein